jgi:inosose dehydratase
MSGVWAATASSARLATTPIGAVPVVWNNVDLVDLAPEVPAATVMDDISRLGYAGCQFGRGFPEGEALRRELAARGLRLAERYCELPSTAAGLDAQARGMAIDLLERTLAAGGETLVVALIAGGDRDAWAGRANEAGAPRWSAAAHAELADLLRDLSDRARGGCGVVFHPHAATWIETPGEVEALAGHLRGSVGLCLDVGHYTVGSGDPVAAIGRYGSLIHHVHLKDVDPAVLARLRGGELSGFADAIRARLFTELGNGMLDLPGVLNGLSALGYDGWLMVEQDSSWLPPAEAAAIGLRVLRFALRQEAA